MNHYYNYTCNVFETSAVQSKLIKLHNTCTLINIMLLQFFTAYYISSLILLLIYFPVQGLWHSTVPHMVQGQVQYSLTMFFAMDLNLLCWTVLIMVWGYTTVGIMMMLVSGVQVMYVYLCNVHSSYKHISINK